MELKFQPSIKILQFKALLLVVFFMLPPLNKPAFSLSCITNNINKKSANHVKDFKLIFRGEPLINSSENTEHNTMFKITDVIKGNLNGVVATIGTNGNPDKVIVQHGELYKFSFGSEYIIFANKDIKATKVRTYTYSCGSPTLNPIINYTEMIASKKLYNQVNMYQLYKEHRYTVFLAAMFIYFIIGALILRLRIRNVKKMEQ